MTPRDLERPHPAYNPFALGAGLLFWFAIFAALVYAPSERSMCREVAG